MDTNTMRPAPPPSPTPSPPPPSAPRDLFAGLNDAQREAVELTCGPVLVLAGAGTGKTRTLTARLAYIYSSGLARPGEILAVTFTNKAAHEMRARAAGLVGTPVEGWWLGTFHALAARILRRHAEVVGLTSRFTILDAADQLRLIKQVMEALKIDPRNLTPKTLAQIINRWKDRGLTPAAVKKNAQDDGLEGGGFSSGRRLIPQDLIQDVYALYQERLRNLDACDFGDLLLHNLSLFAWPGEDQSHPILTTYQKRFRYLLVDEYQDTNVAQYLWLRALAQGHRNLCCVGDEDQSIYGWRGAQISNILRFEEDFPGAKIVRLQRNYRSTGHILAVASGLIAHNRERLGKQLYTEGEMGEPVRIIELADGDEEAQTVCGMIEDHMRDGQPLNDVAILLRTGAQMRAFEERLSYLAIAYRVFGGPRFYERAEIRDALAYLRIIVQPRDNLAFERIINRPRRGLGDKALQSLYRFAEGGSLLEGAEKAIQSDELTGRVRAPLVKFLELVTLWRTSLSDTEHPRLIERVLEESGYVDMLRADKSPDAPGRLENLKELVNATSEFPSLESFLEHVSLVLEASAGSHQDAVSLMTLHTSKGLEFEHVFLPGWEDGIFPHQRALDEQGGRGLEEERRLAYVGLTRARRGIVITCVMRRLFQGRWHNAIASRFLGELPAEHVRMEGQSHRYQGDTVAVLPTPPAFQPGQRVAHRKFGEGTVGHCEDDVVLVYFDDVGEKRIIARYLSPPTGA
ncbi:MAG: UvrD-helicase domain-containing protein [Pseudomonadota bacterium]